MTINGLLLVDKPKNITSNQTLRILKKILNIKKAGIVGILDPLAQGMLPILFGEATKFSSYIESYQKKYTVTCQLGMTSSTGDEEGTIKKYRKNNLRKLSERFIKISLNKFLGQLNQVPPMFSGIKIRGQRLYKLARKGITITRAPRKIFVYDIGLIEYKNTALKFDVTCSKGTYVRTLVEQIGEELSVGAYVKDLRRVQVGKFEEDKMIELNQIKEKSIIQSDYFFDINNILCEIDSFILTDTEEQRIRMGQPIYRFSVFNNKPITMFNKDNIIGIGIIKNNCIYPKRLINFNE